MKIKEIFKLFLIYFIAHGLSLGLAYAQFYDDILFLNWDNNVLISLEKQKNQILDHQLYLILFLKSLKPEIFVLLSFFLFFFSALVFNKIVNTFYLIKKETGYLLTVFYLILPFGLIKFSFIIIYYLLCMFFFLLGWYFIIRSRLLSLFFFFLSFNMQSLLVLYSLPIISYFYHKKKNQLFSVKEFFFFLIRKIDLLILPFIFFFIKFFFYKGTGHYENYNTIYEIRSLILGPILQFLDLFRNNLSIGFLILGFLSAYLILKYILTPLGSYKNKNNLNILIVITGIIGSLFPYWVVGHVPSFVSYTSRHQLLLLISMPLFIFFLFNSLKNKNIKISITLIIALSLSINFKIYSDYYIEYLKQKKFITYIGNNKDLFSNNNVIIMNDKIKNATVTYPNNNNSAYNNGIFKSILNNEKNFVININEVNDYINGKLDYKFNSINLASQHKRQNNNNFILFTIESDGYLKYNFSHKFIFF